MAVGLVCFSRMTNFSAAMFFATLIGFGSMAQFTSCNIIV
jgi:hypothetical protein